MEQLHTIIHSDSVIAAICQFVVQIGLSMHRIRDKICLYLRELNAEKPIYCKIVCTFTNTPFPPNLQLSFQPQITVSIPRCTEGKYLRTVDLIHGQTHPAPKKRRNHQGRALQILSQQEEAPDFKA